MKIYKIKIEHNTEKGLHPISVYVHDHDFDAHGSNLEKLLKAAIKFILSKEEGE